MKKDPKLTPMMQQYFDMKSQHPDAILLFRCGDFYEAYGKDAVVISEILSISLTRRNNGKGKTQEMEMAGFPHHSLDVYLPRLVRAGKRVAICDQLEDPKFAKKLVKRGITEIVTPGVALSDNVLNTRENNFICAVSFGSDTNGVAFLDLSTGEFMLTEGDAAHIDKLLANFAPKELLLLRNTQTRYEAAFRYRTGYYQMDDWMMNPTSARNRLLKHFQTETLKGFGVEEMLAGQTAAGAILHYLDLTLHTQTRHIMALKRIDEQGCMHLDGFTIRNLELLQAASSARGCSLLQVIDKTITPMGARLLRRWLVFPLTNKSDIELRQSIVAQFYQDSELEQEVGERLRMIGDMERIIAKIAAGRAMPRDLLALAVGLSTARELHDLADKDAAIYDIVRHIGDNAKVIEAIQKTISPNTPAVLSKLGVIADGVSEELDKFRSMARGGKDFLLQMQQREIENTGIPSLKIAYNSVFGYYIEVRNTHKDKVPETWIRKQTVTGAERYITPELKEYESQILGAEEKIAVLESQIFAQLLNSITGDIPVMQKTAGALARIDVLHSFAVVAKQRKYVRPTIAEDDMLLITEGRHPVIETIMPAGEEYVSNSVELDPASKQILIITGPNMSGKSALLRQTALICLMAQTGCFVPATKAHIGLVDKIFTRVGASDSLSEGESTFMVEMTEAANIINNATSKSLVLFDELGRGTSTYDGISIAWAIVEHLHENTARARTLFATHYHELADMENSFSRIRNYHVSVKEVGDKVLFLRKLQEGSSEHSFGINVAAMAGMPRSIVKRANDILDLLEKNAPSATSDTSRSKAVAKSAKQGPVQLSIYQLDDPTLAQIRDEILDLDIDNLRPIEALNKLNEIKKILRGK